MVVVSAFGTLGGTENAGMTAYYRAPGCTSITIADILPLLSKIVYYENEYVIGEMLIWDTGSQSPEPNNCVMVRVIVYNDGWICAWFDKTTQNQLGIGGAQMANSTTLKGWGSSLEYPDKWNGCSLTITDSTDPECPIGTVFTIRDTDSPTGRIIVHPDRSVDVFHFNIGYAYSANITMSNGNLVWWGHYAATWGYPPDMSNRLYRAIYQIWSQIKTSSNSTNWSATDASIVYMYDSQTNVYTNKTTDFNDVGVNDCQVLPTDEVINDVFYIGSTNKFSGVTITMGTPGVGSEITWEYWGDSTWSTLSCVDGSSGFTSTGELTFNPPDNWNETPVNGSNYFWIRARVTTAAYTITPVLTQGQLHSQDNIGYLEAELGMYSFEDTGANYCMICGVSGGGVWVGTKSYTFYNTVLPGKIIFDHTMNLSHTHSCASYARFGWCKFCINGTIINQNITSGRNAITEYGFRSYNIEYICSPSIQNVIDYSAYGYTAGAQYPAIYFSLASVLITS